jgi:hypothetical protein
MSLQLAAQHLAARGRGPDTTLVHMTPREVAGLQALAQQHGGSLTINPQTGLPEAGFLSSILPLIAGVGLTAMGMPAGMAALTVGGGAALATGDLKKGLMAGLGAYGGAGLAESLIGSGAAGLVPEAAAASLNAVPTETAAQLASVNQAGLTMPSAVEPSLSASLPSANTAADPFRLGSSVSQETLKAPIGGITSQSPNYTPPITTTPSPLSNVNNITPGGPMAGPSISQSTYPVQPTFENMTAGQRFDALKAGATGQNLLNYAKANPLQTAGMLAGPLMAASEDSNAPYTPVGDADRGAMANAGYQFDPGWTNPTPAPDPYGREQRYNRPRFYIPKGADGGAVQHFDAGGTTGGFNQTPALNKFLQLQAARAATPAPATIDAKQQFADYLKAQSRPVATATPYHPVVESHLPVSSGDLGGGGSNLGGGGGGSHGTSAGFGSGNASSTVGTSDTGGKDFGVTNQPPGAVFNINDFDTNSSNSDFGIGNQPAGTTFDINDFDNNTSAGTVDNSTNDFGIGNQPAGTTFDINDFDNNTSAGTVDNGPTFDINDFDNNTSAGTNDIGNYGNTTGEVFGVTNQPDGATFDINDFDSNTNTYNNIGDYGDTTGRVFGVADQPDGANFDVSDLDTDVSGETVSPEKFSIDYVDPSGLRAENNFVDRMDALDNYTGSDSGNDSGNNFGSDFGSGFDGGFGGIGDGGFGGIGDGGNDYDMNYRAKGGPIKSNFKKAKNINLYKSGLEHYAGGGIAALAQGGMYNLGSYSDGGRLLRGPGDGVSDSIPAVIGQKQPARLADGEFVIPARIVSEIGNGSTEAGARKLYAMMDKVQSARRATVGKGKVAKNTRADRYLPA